MISLSNENINVIINAKGAELQSVRNSGVEYLWQADAKFWGKHAPVLFPIIGELKDGKYIFNNTEYKLPRHGFARDKIFDAEQKDSTRAVFTLTSDEQTFSVYPFEFIFHIEYNLKENELSCTYTVQNINDHVMFFSVGGHPAFNVPLNKNLSYTDYFLQFENDDELKRYLLQNGLLSGETETIQLNNKALQLKPELFYKDAIILKHINSKQITLQSTKDSHGLKFKFDGFPFFGIWAAKDAPFVCLEPWCGVADNIHHDNNLKTKEGINELAAGKTWSRTWRVELF
ncbi:MAG TPA: aldose 1-epimerase family protein [Parafilimonas sp.]|nr:aldose 1-epimerase family protein [Parafilimonas sp.]